MTTQSWAVAQGTEKNREKKNSSIPAEWSHWDPADSLSEHPDGGAQALKVSMASGGEIPGCAPALSRALASGGEVLRG